MFNFGGYFEQTLLCRWQIDWLRIACMSSRISATTTAASTSTRTHIAICSGLLSISFSVFPRHLHHIPQMIRSNKCPYTSYSTFMWCRWVRLVSIVDYRWAAMSYSLTLFKLNLKLIFSRLFLANWLDLSASASEAIAPRRSTNRVL